MYKNHDNGVLLIKNEIIIIMKCKEIISLIVNMIFKAFQIKAGTVNNP